MPGAIVKPGGGTGAASTFAQVAGDPNDNAALVSFVTAKAAAAAAAAAAAGGTTGGVQAVDFSGTASGAIAVGSF